MKAFLIALAVALLVGCASAASAQSASVAGGVNAFAAWQVPTQRGGVNVYWASVFRGPVDDEVRTIAYAGKTRCDSRAWDVFLFFCIDSRGRGELRPLQSLTFNHDPLLGEATLAFSAENEEHMVRWNATAATPSVNHWQFESGGSHDSQTRYHRDVMISGSLFGRVFKPMSELKKLPSLSYDASLHVEE